MHNMPGLRCRQVRHAAGPDHGLDRRVHHRRHRPRRPRRPPARDHRSDRRSAPRIVRRCRRSSSRTVDPIDSAVVSVTTLPRGRRLQRHRRHRRSRRHGALRSQAEVRDLAREAHPRNRRQRSPPRTGRAPASTTTAITRSPATIPTPPASPPPSPARSSASRNARHRRLAAARRRGFLLHAGGPARRLRFSSATATAPACTMPPTISTTRSSRSAVPTGPGWSRRRCRPEFAGLVSAVAMVSVLALECAAICHIPGIEQWPSA